MKQRSVMDHSFSRVPRAEIQRSTFDRSHGVKTTFDAGWLVPIYVDEALPGDTFNMRMSGFARLATPIKPLMDNLHMETFFFAVPNRLVWNNWVKFMGERDDPDDPIDFTIPVVDQQAAWDEGSLADYMGVPTKRTNMQVSALPFRAYRLIWNEWFRDQNLQDSKFVPVDDGPMSQTYTEDMLKRGKRHDYFTSCLPYPQKGDSVELPLGDSVPVVPLAGVQPSMKNAAGSQVSSIYAGSGTPVRMEYTSNMQGTGVSYWNVSGLEADLTDAGATINQFRQAMQIQRLLERDARGGSRYTEIIRSHFGVVSPDARLQRPEYLGGGYSPVLISPVAQTSQDPTQDTPQGNLAGIGTASFSGHGFVKSFTEHCILIGLVCVRADLTYQQGLDRMWSRSTRYDFYWPALSHLGEQAVLNREIYITQTPATDDDVFGYQERYAEYRYKPSRITGAFRSNHSVPLDLWHLSQDFASLPSLGSTFIEENPPIARVIAVPSEPHFIFDGYFQLRCARPMPVYGVPGLVDHF